MVRISAHGVCTSRGSSILATCDGHICGNALRHSIASRYEMRHCGCCTSHRGHVHRNTIMHELRTGHRHRASELNPTSDVVKLSYQPVLRKKWKIYFLKMIKNASHPLGSLRPIEHPVTRYRVSCLSPWHTPATFRSTTERVNQYSILHPVPADLFCAEYC